VKTRSKANAIVFYEHSADNIVDVNGSMMMLLLLLSAEREV